MNNEEDFPYASFCRVAYFEKGSARLQRLCDVEGDKIYERFNPSAPTYSMLFDRNYDGATNFFGIWRWRATSKSMGGFFTTVKLYAEKVPIEIILLPNCNDDETLKRELLSGANIILSSGKALIGYAAEHDTYRGVLCVEKNFKRSGDKLASAVPSLELFEVRARDCIRVDGKIFYSTFSLGAPEKTICMADFDRIIGSKIVSRAKRSSEMFTRKDLKALRSFLSSLASDGFYREIADKCFCSIEEARTRVDDFIFEAQNNLRFEIVEAEARLDELQRESSELKRKLGADQAKHDRLFKSISKHEPIAIAVRRKAALQMNKCYRAGRAIESETLIEHEDVRDFVESLNEMLDNKLFAVCLWTAYMDRIPLLLAGPCAHEIADAFSLALTGKTAAVFDCAGVNTLEDLNICLLGDDEIVALLNPLASNMISYLPELVSSDDKYFFALQPFVEDLKLEPRGLYNYFLPVRTECMLERRPALNFDEKFSSAALVEEMRAKYSPEKIPIAADARLKRLVRDMGKIVAPDQAFANELRSFLEADDE